MRSNCKLFFFGLVLAIVALLIIIVMTFWLVSSVGFATVLISRRWLGTQMFIMLIELEDVADYATLKTIFFGFLSNA